MSKVKFKNALVISGRVIATQHETLTAEEIGLRVVRALTESGIARPVIQSSEPEKSKKIRRDTASMTGFENKHVS